MFIQHNYLRTNRKRSHLTSSDMAFFTGLTYDVSISRWEQGVRTPNITVILIYHLLFDIPIESLFERQKQELTDVLIKRIEARLRELEALPPEEEVSARMAFLNSALTRLTI